MARSSISRFYQKSIGSKGPLPLKWVAFSYPHFLTHCSRNHFSFNKLISIFARFFTDSSSSCTLDGWHYTLFGAQGGTDADAITTEWQDVYALDVSPLGHRDVTFKAVSHCHNGLITKLSVRVNVSVIRKWTYVSDAQAFAFLCSNLHILPRTIIFLKETILNIGRFDTMIDKWRMFLSMWSQMD